MNWRCAAHGIGALAFAGDQVLQLPPAPDRLPGAGYRVPALRDAQSHVHAGCGTYHPAVRRGRAAPAPGSGRRHSPDAEPLQRFTRPLWSTLGLLAAGLAIAVALQLHYALQPLMCVTPPIGRA